MITVRVMQSGDVDSVTKIEQETLSSWSHHSITRELQIERGICLVAVTQSMTTHSQILGWCAGRASGAEAELLKISVQKQVRRQGVGHILLSNLMRVYEHDNVNQLFLEVRSRNHEAISLYEKLGFDLVSKRSNYYSNPKDDALQFKLTIRA